MRRKKPKTLLERVPRHRAFLKRDSKMTHSKCFVVFKNINVLHLESSPFQNFRCGIGWSVSNDRKEETQKKG